MNQHIRNRYELTFKQVNKIMNLNLYICGNIDL